MTKLNFIPQLTLIDNQCETLKKLCSQLFDKQLSSKREENEELFAWTNSVTRRT